MPLKLNVGLSKKIGLPDYGSLGATCHVEVELPAGLLGDGLDQFHERVRRIYAACRQAVEDELAWQRQDGDAAARRPGASAARGNGDATKTRASGSRPTGSATHHASAKQLEYAAQLAGQIRGLGDRWLETLSRRMYSKPVAGLSSLDASGLIDALKAIKAGQIDLNQALSGAAA
jgi:hypothetical protein